MVTKIKKINVKGDIIQNDRKWIYDWLEMDATCPGDISKVLDSANGEDIEVNINSGGGDIFAGSEIYTLLRSYSGKVNINIVGLAASAASVISMAGESKISPTALFMIHNVSSGVSGDHNAMEKQAAVLKEADKSIANAYKQKTGLSDKELLELMDNETWMSAEKAVKLKFVDGVMFDDVAQPVLYNSTSIIKDDVINKIKNLVKKPSEKENRSDFLLAQINLEKLKGAFK